LPKQLPSEFDGKIIKEIEKSTKFRNSENVISK